MDEQEAQYVKPQVDRRQYRRAQIITQVRCEASGHQELLVTRDISAGGLFLRSPKPFASSGEVELSFHLHAGDPLITCHGKIVSSIPGRGMGIEFLQLEEPTRQALEKFVDESL